MTRQQTNQEFVTNEIWDNICNNTVYYNAMQEKFLPTFFFQNPSPLFRRFYDIITDVKQSAKFHTPTLDLRFYAPTLMKTHIIAEYAEFIITQQAIARSIHALPNFDGIGLVNFFFQQGTLTIDALISQLLDCINHIKGLCSHRQPMLVLIEYHSLEKQLNRWLSWAKRWQAERASKALRNIANVG
jgi:hypothetical protein